MQRSTVRSGFSLVELSMVIALIALVVGAIMGGQSLLRAANLRSIGADVLRYTDAVKQFKQKYDYLPGDYPDAESQWGSDVAFGVTALRMPHTESRNGNGNGMIEFSGGGEIFRVWQHLANARLIDGSYSGNSGPNGVADMRAGVNAPQMSIKGGALDMRFIGTLSGSTVVFDGEYGNPFVLSAEGNNTGFSNYPVLSTQDAKSLDGKFDDSYPATGSIRGYLRTSGYQPACTNLAGSAAGRGAYYDLTQDSALARCGLIFITGF